MAKLVTVTIIGQAAPTSGENMVQHSKQEWWPSLLDVCG